MRRSPAQSRPPEVRVTLLGRPNLEAVGGQSSDSGIWFSSDLLLQCNYMVLIRCLASATNSVLCSAHPSINDRASAPCVTCFYINIMATRDQLSSWQPFRTNHLMNLDGRSGSQSCSPRYHSLLLQWVEKRLTKTRKIRQRSVFL